MSYHLIFKYNRNQPIAPFCDFFTNNESNPQNLSCNIDRTAVAFCNLVDNYLYVASFVSIPPEYQVEKISFNCLMIICMILVF